jgi:hypothetical protein
MRSKTYLPGLIRWTRKLCVYITRWQVQIRKHLTGNQLVAFEALVAACNALLAVVPEEAPVN